MISIICGTNRKSSNSLIFSRQVAEILKVSNTPCQILNLEQLPENFIFENEVYGVDDAQTNSVAKQFISNAEKFVFVIPEYNGSFPGVLKAFIDSFSPDRIRGKKAMLIGVSSGRAGNLRGLDHFTAVLNYLDLDVLPLKLAISHCHALIDENSGVVHDQKTINLLSDQINKLIIN